MHTLQHIAITAKIGPQTYAEQVMSGQKAAPQNLAEERIASYPSSQKSSGVVAM